MPGWKPPAVAAVEGEPAEDPMAQTMKEPVIPDFTGTGNFNYISKNATDTVRQE